MEVFNNFKFIILNKIQEKDYITIDSHRKNEIETLNYIDEIKEIRAIFNVNSNCDLSNKEHLLFLLAIKIFERQRISTKNVILEYSKTDTTLNKNYEYMIKITKKLNTLRKFKKEPNKFFFDYIVDKNSLLYNGFHRNQKNGKLIYYNYTNQQFYVKKKGTFYINFFIFCENFLYFFEIDVRDLNINQYFNNKLLNSLKVCQSDRKVLQLTLKLFNIFELTDIYKSKNLDNITCFNTRIEVYHNYLCYKKENKEHFAVKIEKDVIIFEYMRIKNIHKVKKFLKENDTRYRVTKSCFKEFKKLFEFMTKQRERNFIEVELCYRLLESNGLIKKIVHRIYMDNESALRLVLINICANIEVMKMSNIKDHLNEKRELNLFLEDSNIEDMTRIIIKIIKNIDDDFSYIIKCCLFIEIENVLNDTNFTFNRLIEDLRQIGSTSLMNKLVKCFHLDKFTKKYYDLLNIFSKMLLTKGNIEEVIFKTWLGIFQVTSLISGVPKKINIEDKIHIINDEIPLWFTGSIEELKRLNEDIFSKLNKNN
ncbi:uncharacterized protein VNE69_04008 [Vairimorpha necatrix]|uniref:Uncharacterized protein n=1 Tax=Vairimorpha necatrix TaxID=6039 RepID=A0AAX4JB21_9MICR